MICFHCLLVSIDASMLFLFDGSKLVTLLLKRLHYVSPSIADIVMEEAPTTPTLAPPTPTPAFPSGVFTSPPAAAATPIVAPTPLLPPPTAPPQAAPLPDRESRRSGSVGGRMGLTKEVLSAHTQQEEQAFLDRFKDLSKLRVFDQNAPTANPLARGRHKPAAQEPCVHTHSHKHV